MTTILEEVLSQPVSVTQSNKSSTVTKGQALIKVLMNQATKGNRRYIDALITLTDKIGRLVEVSEDERPPHGIMLVPGVARSTEEFNRIRDEVEAERAARDKEYANSQHAIETNRPLRKIQRRDKPSLA